MRKPRIRKKPSPSTNTIGINGQKNMNLYTRKGEKIKYCNYNSGLANDIDAARQRLEPEKEYTVEKVSIYRSSSRVHLKEIEYGPGFNTCLFQNIEADDS